LQDTGYTYRAIAALNRYAAFQRRRAAGPPPRLSRPEARERALALLAARAGAALSEREGEGVLRLYGVAAPRQALAARADEAVVLAREIGFPVALKIESPEIAHKTDVGGVRLGLADEAAVERAFGEIVAAARERRPEAAIAGVLVQEMVGGGVEL